MEKLLHYVWKHKIFPLNELRTMSGQVLEVIDTGLANPHAGPDFFNAKIKLDGVLWIGNIELHQQSSDWYRHHHDTNPAYNSVILHIASCIDTEVIRNNGEPVPQLKLECPAYVCTNYEELLTTDSYPPCYRIIPTLSPLMIHSWMSSLQTERLEQKTIQVENRLSSCNHNWEDVFFITLARNFGFGVNSETFEYWAKRIPLRAVDKHRDNLFQIEALFFGQAGILEDPDGDEYYLRLKKEYRYLAHKFNLTPMDTSLWRFLRLRPYNFPHVRIAQLAFLYHRSTRLLSQLMEKESLKDVRELLRVGTSEYWLTHYAFGRKSSLRTKILSDSSLDLLIINTVVTFLYAYGRHRANELLCTRALSFLEVLKPENNYIIRLWEQCSLKAVHAGDSQALIQLKKEYCDKKKCLYCRFGYEYLRLKK